MEDPSPDPEHGMETMNTAQDRREHPDGSESAQLPIPPSMDHDDVDFMGIQYPVCVGNDRAANKSQSEMVPEIEIKLESSDDEDKADQNSSCSFHHHKKRSRPNASSKVLAGDPGKGLGEDDRHLKGLNDTHSPSPSSIRPTRKRKSTSEVWEFFCRDPNNICRAICSLCRMSVSRGKLGGNFGTTALKRHLESKHPLEWAQRRSMRLKKADVEEDEEETCEDEEEKDEGYQNSFNVPSAQYGAQKVIQASDNSLVSPHSHSLPMTYEIIDSSDEDEDKEKGENTVELGEGLDTKRKKVEDVGRINNPDYSINIRHTTNALFGLPPTQASNSLMLNFPNYCAMPPGARRRRSTSAVWQFFCIDGTNICRAICTLCQTSVSRGKQGGHFGTSALMRHLEGKHPLEWGRGKLNKPKSASIVEAEEEEEEEESDEQIIYPQGQVAFGQYGASGFSVYPDMSDCINPTFHTVSMEYDNESEDALRQNSNVSTEIALPSFKESHLDPLSISLKANGKYPPNHPKAQSWNSSITELMCEMALPYSFVSAKAFQKFMARADPQFSVPTKSFFSGKAVPQLYEAVCEKIVGELKRSECPRVHITAHVWSSDLTMDYLALTAHWALLNSEADKPTERKYAVLCIKRFSKEYTESNIQQELIRQVNLWLSPNALSPGFFISSGDFNLLHAIRGANYTHIPCFTHSLNLLVKDFLQNNRYIVGILTVARKVCSHFVRSARARRILSELQYQKCLPKHSLKTETVPHWTSTFYMLQRLLEQQRAVQEYLVMHKVEMMDVLLTSSQWNLMASLVALLQPFEMATREVNANNSSLSQVLPELRYLHMFLKQIRGHFESKGDANGVVLADSFALKLSTDYGINEMFQKEEYVLSTLLDPRFKGRIEVILPPESDIDQWKQVLVKKVKEVMSSASTMYSTAQASRQPAPFRDNAESEILHGKHFDLETGGMGMVPNWRRNVAAPPLIHKEKSLIEHLESVGLLASKSTGASLSTESHSACVMVEKYLQDNKTIGAKDDPLIYWHKRTWVWPALTKLAVMYLTCPPSSIFAERVFKSPHTFADKQRLSDIMEGMEHIVFLKFNLKNFPDYNPPPLIFSSDNETEQSDSEEGF
ncbi:zinc finger BED domain-containing protein 6-like [Pseudophryne corroboree]|uniref:zinc finger BED domain-containing protein 6-like n=1 Tax=Pseudophryne corroboree TaxID=495146 RepID=UPI003081B7E5